MEKRIKAILKIISESNRPIGSGEISSLLKELGIDLPERTVRYHLKQMSEEGLIKVFWKEGRMITKKGQDELADARVFDKVGLVSARIESLAYQMTFDLQQKSGSIILNLSFFHKSDFPKALKIMGKVFKKKLAMGEKVLVAKGGEEIGGIKVPVGKVGFGTLCTINLNGIFVKHAIPIESKFGGVLQVENGQPSRFTELISYSGSTLDPHEIFIKSKMTSVREAAEGSGKILAGLREIPAAAKESAEKLMSEMEEAGLGRALLLSKPGSEFLGMPVGEQRVGLVVPGGLNPIAAVEEWNIETQSKALSALVDFNNLVSFWDL